jgi:hypothetical protein
MIALCQIPGTRQFVAGLILLLSLTGSPDAVRAQEVKTVECLPATTREEKAKILGGDATATGCRSARIQQRADLEQDHNFSVPESPAFTFIGASPTEITRPTSPREFAAGLLSGMNAAGQVQQGFALEVSPFPVVPGFMVTLREYQSSFLKRAAYRTQVSLGTVRTEGDSASTDIGFGIRSTLFDEADPMQSRTYTDSLSARMLGCIPDVPLLTDSTGPLRCIEDAIDSAQAIALAESRERWNSRRVTVAFASGTRFLKSDPHERVGLGWRAWALGSNPLGRWGMILGYLEVGRHKDVVDSLSYGSFRYGGRAVVGSSTLNGFLEVIGESRFDATAAMEEGGKSWSAGVELKATDGIWLSTGFGQRYTSADAPDRLLVVANLRFGLSKGGRFTDLQRNTFESE